MNCKLQSKRVILQEMEESDWIGVHKYASQSKVCQYQPWGPNSEQESINFVKQVLVDAQKQPRSRYVFSLILKENEEMIGAGEFNIRDDTNQAGEIAYIVNPRYWGLGYATEAAKQLIAFGFNELNLHRIFATCDARNIASAKVLEKAGMIKEGVIRENILIKDGWCDSLLFSILDREWR